MHSFLHSLDGHSLPQLRGKLLMDILGKHRQAPATHLLSPFSPPVPLQSEAKGELVAGVPSGATGELAVLPINVTFPRDSALGKQAEPSTGPDRQEANPRHQHRQWEFGIRGHTADGFTRAPTQKHGEDLSCVIFSNLSKNWRWIHPTGTA